MLEKLKAKINRLIRRTWMRRALKGTSRGDRHEQLETAYRIRDPWNMESPLERARFEATNRMIERHIGKVGSLFEIGCGEGHQSEYLSRLSEELYAIDVSVTAIERARTRVPKAQFAATDLQSQPWGDRRFDLVTACEVLYYMSDIRDAIERMSRLGRHCLVTCYSPTLQAVDAELERIPGLQRHWIHHGSTVWLVAWWRND